jgi:hypothetical protein
LLNVGQEGLVYSLKTGDGVAFETENLDVGEIAFRKIDQLVPLQQQLAYVLYLLRPIYNYDLVVRCVNYLNPTQLDCEHQVPDEVLVHVQSL